MNKARRKALRGVVDTIMDARAALEPLTDEETEYRDNMPENLQGSEKAERADESASALENALDSLDDAVEQIEIAIGD